MNLLDFPNELIVQIIIVADVETICNLSRVCKTLRNCCDSNTVWKCKWKELTKHSALNFSKFSENIQSKKNKYKTMYQRLWSVWFSNRNSEGILLNFVNCPECKQYTCSENCSQLCHIAVDVGSSTTRIATEMQDGFLSYSHHPSNVGIVRKDNFQKSSSNQQTVRHYLPDSSCAHNPNKSLAHCSSTPRSIPTPRNRSVKMARSLTSTSPQFNPYYLSSSLPCEELRYQFSRFDISQRHNSFHEISNYRDMLQPSDDDLANSIDSDSFDEDWQIVCLACTIMKKDNRSVHQNSWKNSRSAKVSSFCSCVCHHRSKRNFSRRRYWYCQEAAFQNMHDKSCVSISPLEAISVNNILSCLEFHITHILKLYQPHVDLHRPNVTAVFCEPWNITHELRYNIAKVMFERIKVPRLIFVNKAIAASYLKDCKTCIVIDSGCFNTVTSIIINRNLNPKLVYHSMVGGNTVTESLLEKVQISHPNEYFNIYSIDHCSVKRACHVPYVLSLDQKRHRECKVKIKSCCSQKFSYYDIGAASYLAPEVMYVALDLPGTIKHLVKDLNKNVVTNLLRNIIMIGGNSKLEGFSRRLAKDIRDIFPNFCQEVNVSEVHRADRMDAIHGALIYSQSCLDVTKETKKAVTREQYIIHGPNIFKK